MVLSDFKDYIMNKVMGYGGEYSSTLTKFNPPNQSMKKMYGYGWTIPLSRYSSLLKHSNFRTNWLLQDNLSQSIAFVERRVDVLLVYMGDLDDYDFLNLLFELRQSNLSGIDALRIFDS